MIFNKKPVADIQAVAIDGERLALKRVEDHERDQLLRKLPRTIVIRAVGGDDGETIGVVPSAHEHVRGSLGGCIWAVRRVGCGFRKSRIVGAESSVDFIGRDVEKAKGLFISVGQGLPVLTSLMEQVKCADNVGPDKSCRTCNGAIDV